MRTNENFESVDGSQSFQMISLTVSDSYEHLDDYSLHLNVHRQNCVHDSRDDCCEQISSCENLSNVLLRYVHLSQFRMLLFLVKYFRETEKQN